MSKPLLSVRDLKVYYPVKIKNGFFNKTAYLKAVDGISFDVNEGETFGIVGESGCGKSTTGKTIVRLNTPTEGTIEFDGKDLFTKDKQGQKEFSKAIQIIFQDPYSSLDPRFTVTQIIEEPMLVHNMGNKQERHERVLALMKDVGLREDQCSKYPHEFSGGQRQRIGVARALASNPKLIVCDEPVSALDVSIQAQILNLMDDLQKKHNLTYIFISHNLSVVKHVCSRIAVMYLGNIVEIADRNGLFDHPYHQCSLALMKAIPIPDPQIQSASDALSGDVPSPLNPPNGCCFHTRCPQCMKICSEVKPKLFEKEPGHFVACHLFDEESEKNYE